MDAHRPILLGCQAGAIVAVLSLLVLTGPPDARAEAESPPGWLTEAAQAAPAGRGARPRGRVEAAWLGAGAPLGVRASAVRPVALETGLPNAGGPARALVAPSRDHLELSDALLAAKLAPDVPMIHVALASVLWRDGERGAAIRALGAAVAAVPRSLESSLWLASSLLAFLTVVSVLGALAFIGLVGSQVFPRAAHDLGDLVTSRMPGFARAALLASVVLLPMALGEGVLGASLGLVLVGAMYGGARHRMALVLACALLVLGLFPIAELAGRALGMLSADPVAAAALAVRQGVQTRDDVALLRSAADEDRLAEHALAVEARQAGRVEEALERYERLASTLPDDPVVANNLGNLYFRAGDNERAIERYVRATRTDDYAVAWFNLSQAYARAFQMEPFEAALARAQQLGEAEVVELSQLGDPKLVADVPLALGEIRARLFTAAHGAGFAAALRAPVAPGRLGNDWRWLAGAFAFLLLAGASFGERVETAGACTRCGVRVCTRCDGVVWDDETCDNCHRLFHQPETTDAALRAARLEELRAREARVGRLAHWASVIVPGVGGLAAGRPDLGLLALLCFVWAGAAVVLHDGIVPDPLVLGATGPVLLLATGAMAMLAYVSLVLASLILQRSR